MMTQPNTTENTRTRLPSRKRHCTSNERKVLAMSLRNARHRVVASAEGDLLLLVQMSEDALAEIVRLLDEKSS